MPKAARALALGLLAAALALPAIAQVLYRWVDADGRTQYSDKAPKGFKGEVTRIDTEVEKSTMPPSKAPMPAPAPAAAKPAAGTEDIGAKRRATRTRLEQRLASARANVDAAKKALTESEVPQDEERQVVQQRLTTGGMHGMAPRSNCRTEVGKDGRKHQMCPVQVPTPEYHDRVAGLEANLRKAEEELADAEQAWRRGVD